MREEKDLFVETDESGMEIIGGWENSDECMELQREIEADFFGKTIRKPFDFLPSFQTTYKALKQENPEWARIYIEALMNYGVENTAIPKEAIEIGIVSAFLETNTKTIDKGHRVRAENLKKGKKNAKRYFEKAHENAEQRRSGEYVR